MNCQEYRSMIEDALDDSLQGELGEIICRHLEHCPECRGYLAMRRQEHSDLFMSINAAYSHPRPPPEDFTDRLIAAVAPRRPLPFFLRLPRWALVAASVAIMFMGVVFAGVVVERVISSIKEETATSDVPESEAPQETLVADAGTDDSYAPQDAVLEEVSESAQTGIAEAISTTKTQPTTTETSNNTPSTSTQQNGGNEKMNIRKATTALAAAFALVTSGAGAADIWLNEAKTLEEDWSVSGFLALAQNSSNTGILNIGSDDSSYNLNVDGNLIIGHSGRGELYLNSGSVSASSGSTKTYIGNNGGATGLVVINGGTFTANTDMYVGEKGTGTLTINENGTVDAKSNLVVGNNGGTGTMTINNGGIASVSGALKIGNKGMGTLTINEGGAATVSGALSVGNTSSSGSSLTVDGGSLVFGGTQSTVNNGEFTIKKGSVTLNGNGHLDLGQAASSPGTMTVKSGGSYTGTGNDLGLIVGWNAPGILNVEGGTVTLRNLNFSVNAAANDSTVNVTDGGVLELSQVKVYNGTANTALLNIDGGTVKARPYNNNTTLIANNSGLTINVGSNGAEFDSAGYAITIPKEISGAGAVRFKGGNTITLSGANTYTGGTTIELGTKVVASTADAKAAVLDNGLVIDGRAVLAGGEYDVLMASGLTAADLEKVTLVNCAAGSTKDFDDPETPTKIVVTLAEPTCLTTSFSLLFPGKTLDDIKEADFTCRFCGAAAPNCIQLDSGKGYNKKLYFTNGSLTGMVVEMQVADGNFVKCVVVQFQNSDDGVKGRIFGSNAKYVSSQSLGYVFLEPDTTTWHGSDQSIATTRTDSGYGICDLRVTAAAATVEWTLDADKNWSDFSGYDALGADDFVRITATGNYTLTMDKDVNVGKIEFMGASGSTMSVSSGKTVTTEGVSGIGNILNNGTIVKKGDGMAYMPFNNASVGVTVVNSGTLKIASHTGDGSSHTVRVKSGATFDMNGWGDTVVSVILEEGANFVNSRGNIGNATKQAKSITLDGDATATASNNFGLVGGGYAETTLALGSNTLTLNGNAAFWLVNTTITGDGTIAVNSGTLMPVQRASTGTNCTLNIGASGTLRIENNQSLAVKNFHNGGMVMAPFKSGNAWYAQGMLVVTGTLMSGNVIPKLTLADGATVKATGTAQTVSTTFTATGAYTIDASAITKAQLNEAEEQRIPVLTVPTANKGGFWEVSGLDAFAKWFANDDDTSTLYLCKPIGLMVIIR